jgi:ubiquinone/menaquinone biosynthesis C-methylase UbiE
MRAMLLGSIISQTDLPRNCFERYYLRILGIPNIGTRMRLKRIYDLSKANITPSASVLDAGCGNGLFALTIGSITSAGKIFGVDIDVQRVERANARAKMLGLDGRVSFEVQDLVALSFDDASFDLITCADVIEHIQEDERAIAELYRVLRPNGKLVLSTVTPAKEQRSFVYRVTAQEHGHVREGYSKTDLLRLVQNAGYVVERFHWSDRYLDRLAWEVDQLIGQRMLVRGGVFPILLLMARLDVLLPVSITGNNMTVLARKLGG